jgi:hypothetical protein
MIVKALHPSIEGNIRTNLTTKAVSGQADLVVQNSVDFSADDFVVVGLPGDELSEIAQIDSISGKTITLTANLNNSHPENTKITFIKYDQIKFYKATTINGTYSLVSTKDISIDEPHTLYDDSSALATDYFKIKYYNSHDEEESVFSDAISSSGFPRYALIKIQDLLFKRFRDEKEQYLEREEITAWINEIKDDLVNRIIDCNEKYFNNSKTLDVDSDGEADLGDNFRKFQKVFVLFDGVNGKRARKIELEDINDYVQTFSQEMPFYYFRDYKIGVRPKGTVGTTKIQVVFEDQPADIENDSDELPKPLRFYMGVIMDGLMAKASEKAGKDSRANRYFKKYEDGVQNMIEETNNLVLDENREVRDEEMDSLI